MKIHINVALLIFSFMLLFQSSVVSAGHTTSSKLILPDKDPYFKPCAPEDPSKVWDWQRLNSHGNETGVTYRALHARGMGCIAFGAGLAECAAGLLNPGEGDLSFERASFGAFVFASRTCALAGGLRFVAILEGEMRDLQQLEIKDRLRRLKRCSQGKPI